MSSVSLYSKMFPPPVAGTRPFVRDEVVAHYQDRLASFLGSCNPRASFLERAHTFRTALLACSPLETVRAALDRSFARPPETIEALAPVWEAAAEAFFQSGSDVVSGDGSTDRPSLYGTRTRDKVARVGVPRIAGTRQGFKDYKDLLNQLVEVGLASLEGGSLRFHRPLWMKAPGMNSRPISTELELKMVFRAIELAGVHQEALVEVFIQEAHVVRVTFDTRLSSDHWVDPQNLEIEAREVDPKNLRNAAIQLKSLEPVQIGQLRTYMDSIAASLNLVGVGVASFIVDPRTGEIFFLKVKMEGEDLIPSRRLNGGTRQIQRRIQILSRLHDGVESSLRAGLVDLLSLPDGERTAILRSLQDMPVGFQQSLLGLLESMSKKIVAKQERSIASLAIGILLTRRGVRLHDVSMEIPDTFETQLQEGLDQLKSGENGLALGILIADIIADRAFARIRRIRRGRGVDSSEPENPDLSS